MKKVQMKLKIVQIEQYIYSFELLFISTTHVVPRAVVEMNNSSNGSSSNEHPIAGQTSGPIGLKFFVDNHGCNRLNKLKKNFQI